MFVELHNGALTARACDQLSVCSVPPLQGIFDQAQPYLMSSCFSIGE
jgi:hypothetical protein